jgi:hypothetical protein
VWGVRTRDDVLLGAEKVGHGFLLDVGVVFVELIGESEGYDGETGVVLNVDVRSQCMSHMQFIHRGSYVCAVLAFVVLLLALFELEVAFLAVDVTDTAVPAL